MSRDYRVECVFSYLFFDGLERGRSKTQKMRFVFKHAY